MVHHYKQTVIKVFLGLLLLTSILDAKEVPILKTVSINVPLKEYSIVDFPFKIKDVQFNTFTYKEKIKRRVSKSKYGNSKNGITLSKKGKVIPNKKLKKPKNNILGLTKGVNILTFKPKFKGYTQMIIWGYSQFPIILKVNVVNSEDADQYIKFVEVLNKKEDVVKFESSSHEKIIENITKHLYDENYKSKPSGYESIVRKRTYDVEVKDYKGNVIAVVRNSLIREVIGRDYLGQVWNVNLIKNIFPNRQNLKNDIDNNLEVSLYEEMFDEDGIFSVSLETYKITKKHGTRVMIVRRRN